MFLHNHLNLCCKIFHAWSQGPTCYQLALGKPTRRSPFWWENAKQLVRVTGVSGGVAGKVPQKNGGEGGQGKQSVAEGVTGCPGEYAKGWRGDRRFSLVAAVAMGAERGRWGWEWHEWMAMEASIFPSTRRWNWLEWRASEDVTGQRGKRVKHYRWSPPWVER